MEHLDTPQGRRIAYRRTAGQGTGVVFLGGFKSDMEGTKALHLEGWARRRGRPFLRFDYSGHGASSGRFEEGAIGDWRQDAEAALGLTQGRQVLVGSSMGGWIALLLARAAPGRVAGLVLIAPAPDFTEDGYWAGFSAEQRAALERDGVVRVPSDYGEPYPITRRLIEQGREELVLRAPLPLPFPVRILIGTADDAVPVDWAVRLLDHMDCPDARATLVKGADHRFSEPGELALIEAAVKELAG